MFKKEIEENLSFYHSEIGSRQLKHEAEESAAEAEKLWQRFLVLGEELKELVTREAELKKQSVDPLEPERQTLRQRKFEILREQQKLAEVHKELRDISTRTKKMQQFAEDAKDEIATELLKKSIENRDKNEPLN